MNKNNASEIWWASVLIPLAFGAFFYLTYAQNAWFYQDDFGMISQYATSLHTNQIFDFSNFGRFVSRNMYWYFGVRYFSFNPQCYFLLNLTFVVGTSYLLFKTFSTRYGYYVGVLAGACYFLLPATIETYCWLSNSQHLIGHFFVALFIYLCTRDTSQSGFWQRTFIVLFMLVTLMLGYMSNIFVSMVVSLPVWLWVVDKQQRNKRNLAIAAFGFVLFVYFYKKLAGDQSGAYVTSYKFDVILENIQFYYSLKVTPTIWLTTIVIGSVVSLLRKKYLTAWLFLASIAFIVPFLFFVHQRYNQYGTLSNLFLTLGVLCLIYDLMGERWPRLAGFFGSLLLLCVFIRALSPTISYFAEHPLGQVEKHQIDQLHIYDMEHPDVKSYCFKSAIPVVNTTGVKIWDVPREWWGSSFGTAFRLFVNPTKTFQLQNQATHCDVVFVFKNEGLFRQPDSEQK